MSYWTLAPHFGNRKPMFELDFSTPVSQVFPQTTTALSSLGVGTGTASAIWDFNESSSPVLDHSSNGYNLTSSGSPIFSRKGLGIYSSGLDGKSCVEFRQGQSDSLDASSSSVLDPGSGSYAVLVVFRCGGIDLAEFTPILGKFNSSYNGFVLRLENYGDTLVFRHRINPDLDIVNVSSSWCDGAVNVALIVLDKNADAIGIYTNRGNNEAFSLNVSASITNTALFQFGEQASTGSLKTPPQLQVLYSAVWLGSAAEGMDETDVAAFWNHATDPNGELTTIDHASTIYDRASDTQVAAWVDDELPIGYNSGLSNTNSLGLRGARPISTLLSESDDFATTWTATNVTISAAVADRNDSPRELKESQKLTASANDGYLEHLFTTTAEEVYTIGCYIKRHSSMGSDVTGRVIMYDDTGSVENSAQAFTATTSWQRVLLTDTTNASQISTGFRIEIDTSSDVICVAFATAVAGKEWLPIYTEGGTASIAVTDYAIAGSANDFMLASKGEIDFTAIQEVSDHDVATEYMDSNSDGSTDNNRNQAWSSSDQKFNFQIYNSSGSSVFSISSSSTFDLSVEREVARQWNASTAIKSGKYARLFVDGDEEASYSTGTWTYGNLNDEISLMSKDGATAFMGLLSRYRAWRGPRTDNA